jgi:hypothetical protein
MDSIPRGQDRRPPLFLEPGKVRGMAEERREDEVREVARGRSTRTPFVVLGSVAATVWAVAALIVGVTLLLWWLL